MPTMYCYSRVSKQDQADNGHSLQAQREAGSKFYDYDGVPKGYAWGGVYEDKAVSGKKAFFSRQAGGMLQRKLEAGDCLVFTKVDRGFRDTHDQLGTIKALTARGVRVVFLDANVDSTTAAGEMMLTAMGMVATFERKRISERTKEGLAVARAKGRLRRPRLGQRVVGRKKQSDRRVVPDKDVLLVGVRVLEWRLMGHTFETIWKHLKNSGVKRYVNKHARHHNGAMREWAEKTIRNLVPVAKRFLADVASGAVPRPEWLDPKYLDLVKEEVTACGVKSTPS